MTTDVAERPTTQADPNTESTDVSTTVIGTEQDDSAQADLEVGTDSTSQSSPVPESRQARLTALADAEREEAVQRGRDEALAEIQQGNTSVQREANRNRLKQSFPTAIRTIDSIIANAKDDYGNPRALTPAESVAAKKVLEDYSSVAWESASAEVSDIVRDAVYAKIHKDDHPVFAKLTEGDTALPAYLDAYAEVAALRTKAVKTLDLESAMKHSPTLKRQILARDIEQHDVGFEAGLGAPAGTSPDSGRGNQKAAPKINTFADLEKGYGEGSLTKDQDTEYKRLKAARSNSR